VPAYRKRRKTPPKSSMNILASRLANSVGRPTSWWDACGRRTASSLSPIGLHLHEYFKLTLGT
jgi:hypothetical protein